MYTFSIIGIGSVAESGIGASLLLAAILVLQCFDKHNHSDDSDETGQCHSNDIIYQQAGENSLTSTLTACSNHIGLMHIEKHLPTTGRTSAREGHLVGD